MFSSKEANSSCLVNLGILCSHSIRRSDVWPRSIVCHANVPWSFNCPVLSMWHFRDDISPSLECLYCHRFVSSGRSLALVYFGLLEPISLSCPFVASALLYFLSFYPLDLDLLTSKSSAWRRKLHCHETPSVILWRRAVCGLGEVTLHQPTSCKSLSK